MSLHPEINFEEFKNFTERLSGGASEIAVRNFGGNIDKWYKKDETIVTEVDLEIEKFIRAKILERYPSHSILGEEQQNHEGTSDYSWVIDPLDGTINYAVGVPLYGILVGLTYKGLPLYGSYRLPSYDNVFCAGGEKKLYCKGFKPGKRKARNPKEWLFLTSDIERLENSSYSKNWQSLRKIGATIRTWGDCFGYHLLVAGNADLMIDVDLKFCDILPLIPIVEAAGLVIDRLNDGSDSDILAYQPHLSVPIKNNWFR